LRRAAVDEAETERVLATLRQLALLDDRAFAEYWVDQRQQFRPRGARLLRAELARLGVSRAGAAQATRQAETTAEADAYRAAAGQARRLGRLDEATFRRRLAQWLARRGFDWDSIVPVINRLAVERAEHADPAAQPSPRDPA